MVFFDEVKIRVESGSGGDGCVSFRREKYVEFGGPDGGDGGRGGSVLIVADKKNSNLNYFAYKNSIRACNGGRGRGSRCCGASAKDIILEAPLGTQIFTDDKEEMIGECIDPNKPILLLSGGDGGSGNARFKSSTNRAPRYFTDGKPGESRFFLLLLKMMADVGIIGMPNAGKSTFLSLCSNAKPKIADYPFTTLNPNLGMVRVNYDSFIMMDIPGLVKGSHVNVGLGHRFLKHIERCSVVLHLIDVSNPDVVSIYDIVREELEGYDQSLIQKKEVVVLNKTDLVGEKELIRKKLALERRMKSNILKHSITTNNSDEIINVLLGEILAVREENRERTGDCSSAGPYDPLSYASR